MSQRTDTVHRFEDEVFFGLQRRAALFGWMAGLSLATALCAVGAMVVLLPLKEIRPYVVMVDRQSGESELVVSTRPADLAETDAVRQAELVRYVTEREPYDTADNRERIPAVLATSQAQAATSLRALWTQASDQYPPALYGEDSLIRVKVRSIAVLNDATAQVRLMMRSRSVGLSPSESTFTDEV